MSTERLATVACVRLLWPWQRIGKESLQGDCKRGLSVSVRTDYAPNYAPISVSVSISVRVSVSGSLTSNSLSVSSKCTLISILCVHLCKLMAKARAAAHGIAHPGGRRQPCKLNAAGGAPGHAGFAIGSPVALAPCPRFPLPRSAVACQFERSGALSLRLIDKSTSATGCNSLSVSII
jgi:hypothetical protein